MICTSQPLATQVGLAMLLKGGNALDAAIAAGATLGVVEPAMTGIGGDCFLLYHEASSGRLYGLNGSGYAPARAAPEDLRRRGYTAMPERGILSVTVPGAVHAWATALKRFGTLGLDEILAPAIRYAEEGYAVSPVVAGNWKQAENLLAAWEDSRTTLLVDGEAPRAGTRHRQPALARSLKSIAAQGSDAFYQGEIAEAIVRFSKANDGLLELDDLASYASEWVEPIHTDYRGLRIYELPPNGQGTTPLMMLNILENAPLTTLKRLSAEHIHLFTEAFKLATAERNRFIGDPRFNEIPLETLLSKAFAARQWGRIQPGRALPAPVPSGLPEHRDTVYLTVVDENRNAVSFINSLFHAFGSGRVAGDTGIVLQNRGVGFVLEEDHSNCLAPRKRPLHTIIPAMAYRDDRLVLSFGVMGGQYQAMGHSYVLSNWWDFGLDLQEALDAPRFFQDGGVLSLERPIARATRETLIRWGHRIAEVTLPLGGGQCIYIDAENGILQGASDSRKDGCAIGY